jgi:hypothetical protein
MKYEVLIYEPVLEDRKSLSQLFPLKKYLVSFYSTYNEIAKQINSRIPHIVLINFDKKVENIIKLLPVETFIVGLSKDDKHSMFKNFESSGLSEMWKKPVSGFKVTPSINSFIDNITPLKLSLSTPQIAASTISGTIRALGETDFVIKVPFSVSNGADLNLKCALIENILSEVKQCVVLQNMEGGANSTDKILRLTLLGLRNTDLQEIRSEILHWDKF